MVKTMKQRSMRMRKHKGGKKSATRTKTSKRRMRGGTLNGILGAARTALLPYIMYKGQKRQQKKVHKRGRKSKSRSKKR